MPPGSRGRRGWGPHVLPLGPRTGTASQHPQRCICRPGAPQLCCSTLTGTAVLGYCSPQRPSCLPFPPEHPLPPSPLCGRSQRAGLGPMDTGFGVDWAIHTVCQGAELGLWAAHLRTAALRAPTSRTPCSWASRNIWHPPPRTGGLAAEFLLDLRLELQLKLVLGLDLQGRFVPTRLDSSPLGEHWSLFSLLPPV